MSWEQYARKTMSSTSTSTYTLLHQNPKFEFPFKLHILLEDAVHEGNEHIVSWLPHCRAFKIHAKRQFEVFILPRYYTTSKTPKYRSFARQLGIYGFQLNTDRTSPDHGCYSHPLMVRGKPELCQGMVRQKIKRITERSSFCSTRSSAGKISKQIRQPLLLVNDCARRAADFWGFVRCQERNSAACNSEMSFPNDADRDPNPPDDPEPSIPASILRQLSGNSNADNLLTFAILANEYLAARTTKPSSSPLTTHKSNSLALISTSDASSYSRACTSQVLDEDWFVLGANNSNNDGGRLGWTMSQTVSSSDEEHNIVHESDILEALNQLLILQGGDEDIAMPPEL